MRKTRDTSAVWGTIWVLLLTGAEGFCAEPAATLKAHGLHYELQEIKEPRVNRIYSRSCLMPDGTAYLAYIGTGGHQLKGCKPRCLAGFYSHP